MDMFLKIVFALGGLVLGTAPLLLVLAIVLDDEDIRIKDE